MPAAVAIPSIIGLGTSIVGGVLGSNAADKASKQQQAGAAQAGKVVADATAGGQKGVGDAAVDASNYVNTAKDTANGTLKDVYNSENSMLSPYQQAGTKALNDLSNTSAFAAPTAQEVQATPGYGFQLAQGMKALQQAAAARGTLGSSGTLKSLSQFNQGLASTYYQNAFNNSLQTYGTNVNRLNTLANYGQNANSQAIQIGTNYGNQVSANDMNAGLFQGNTTNRAAEFGANIGMEGAKLQGDYITGGANAKAAGTVGSTNAWTNTLNNVGTIANGVGSYYASRDGSGGSDSAAPAGFTPYSSGRPYNPVVGIPPAANGTPPVPNIPFAPGATPSMRMSAVVRPNTLRPPSVAPVG